MYNFGNIKINSKNSKTPKTNQAKKMAPKVERLEMKGIHSELR